MSPTSLPVLPPDHTAALIPVDGGTAHEPFDLSPVAMALTDAAGLIVRANLRVSALVGIAPEDLVGQHWTNFSRYEDGAAADRAVNALVAGRVAVLTSPDFRFRRPDGQDAWFRATTSLVGEPDGGSLLLVQLTDLSEERAARAAVDALLERHDRDAAVVRSSDSAIVAIDTDAVVTTWNGAAEELLGWSESDALGRPAGDLFPHHGPHLAGILSRLVKGDQPMAPFATSFVRRNGDQVAVDVITSRVLDDAGDCVGISGIVVPHDANAPEARVRRLSMQQHLFSRVRSLINSGATEEQVEQGFLFAISSVTVSAQVVLCEVRDDGATLRLRASLGWKPGQLPVIGDVDESTLVGRAVLSGNVSTVDNWNAAELPAADTLVEAGLIAGLAIPVKVGGKVVAAFATYRKQAGLWSREDVRFIEELARMYGALLESWNEAAARRQLELHDRLTGLPSLTLLVDRLEQALDRDRGLGVHTGLLVLDIDHFQFVNDTLGHDVGDRLLTAVVPRLQSVVRPGDTIARLSGDEFVIVAGELDDEAGAMLLAEAVLDVFAEPFAAAGEEHVLSVSIGLTVATAETTAQEMLSDADAATFRAKELGRNRIEVFDRSLRERVTERVRTERELRGAVERGELSLRYQPIIDMRTGFIEGFEALVRWQHAERGLVGPVDFIQIAEESGLILGLGEWVLRTACTQAAEWLDEFELPLPFRVSVNLSGRQLGDRAIVATILDALEQSGLPATSLALEVTESVLIEQDEAVDILTDLRKRGVRIMLDDFGTGYSSLSYLRRFEVDALKIDRSFVSELGERRLDALLVSALIQMANALNIDAVAEGVETAQQAQMLRMLGCTLAQGFHFARPLTIADATELLRGGGVVPGGRSR